MTRAQLALITVVLAILSPVLILVLVIDVIAGCDTRAHAIQVALDEAGNAALGGDPTMTISARTGNGLIQGLWWAKPGAAFIDFFFGKGHCLANATVGK